MFLIGSHARHFEHGVIEGGGGPVLGEMHEKQTLQSVIDTMPGYTLDRVPASGTLIAAP